jgi:hypothetical protein
MVAYTGIQGQNILIVSSDPANPVEGQIWYNTTSNLLKGYANVVTNAWASGGNLNTARKRLAAAGNQTSALAFGGAPASVGGSNTTATELYNGTAWTNNPTGLNTGNNGLVGAGTQTAALGFGGYVLPAGVKNITESWNGSIWTSLPGTLNTARGYFAGLGTQTAALAFGGYTPSATAATESWNGSSWTNVNSMNTARFGLAGAGIQTAALAFGGQTGPGTSTESWNGTSWTSVNSMNTPRGANSGAGIQTLALTAGGTPNPAGATELWNGTSWSSNPTNLNTSRFGMGVGPGGTQTAAIIFGGANPGDTPQSATEEWTGTALAIRTITTS